MLSEIKIPTVTDEEADMFKKVSDAYHASDVRSYIECEIKRGVIEDSDVTPEFFNDMLADFEKLEEWGAAYEDDLQHAFESACDTHEIETH